MKNTILGLLALVIVGVGIYFIMRNSDEVVVTPVTPVTPGTNTYPTPNTPDTSPTPSTPVVQTGASVAVTGTTVTIAGQVKPNGPTTSYWYEYGTTASLGLKTTEQGIGSGFSALSAPGYISGLKANTVYYFRINAKNIYGTVNGTIESFKTNNDPAQSGKAPTSTTSAATDISRSGATLKGTINPNGANSNYWFEYGTDINFGTTTIFQAIGNSNSTSSVAATLSGLNPLTKYYFRLNGQNQFGTVNGGILNFTTWGPVNSSQPTVNTNPASNVNSTTVKLNGRVNPNGAQTTYWFEYSQDSLLGSLIGSGTAVQTLGAGSSNVNVNADVSGLAKDTKYYYRLVAKNDKGTVQGVIMSFTSKK